MTANLYGASGSPERRQLDAALAVLGRHVFGRDLAALLDEVAYYLNRTVPNEPASPHLHGRLSDACLDVIRNLRALGAAMDEEHR